MASAIKKWAKAKTKPPEMKPRDTRAESDIAHAQAAVDAATSVIKSMSSKEATRHYDILEREQRVLEMNYLNDEKAILVRRQITPLMSIIGPIMRGMKAADPEKQATYAKAWAHAMSEKTADAWEVAADAAEEAGLNVRANQARAEAALTITPWSRSSIEADVRRRRGAE